MLADDWNWLRHMADAYQQAIQLLGDRDVEALEKNLLVRKGLLQWMEIGADAAKHVGKEIREPNAHIPWAELAVLHKRLGSEAGQAGALHRVVTDQLPAWVAALRVLLADE